MKIPDQYENVLSNSVNIEPIQTEISDQNMALTFRLEFLPLRSFKTMAEFLVTKSTGGRWR